MAQSNKPIYLSPPHMSGMEEKYVREAFESNWIAPLGPHVDAFEKEFARYTGAKGALALSSGTAALHLALRYIGVEPGDTVFCSTLTFVASANPILYRGALPVFIDSEPESWNMSPLALKRALREAEKNNRLPKAIIVVNLYGQSADMEPILELCRRYGVTLIEDAAESLGATYDGKPSGTFGKFGIFSFNGNKIITTSGGGMLVSHDTEALEKACFWATQARDPANHYQHSEVGYNYRLSNILAAVGRGQLEVLEERIKSKRAVFERYREALSSIKGLTFMPEAPFGRSTRWLTVLTLDPRPYGVSVGDILQRFNEQSIEARPVWKPMHLQPLFQRAPYYPHHAHESISDRLFAQGLCLPSGSNLTLEQQQKVIEVFTEAIKE
ncbi:DegT/DnrJ/EryC1/StrS family aminotransferase [Candidatus Contubernalis alkaliaceticus]|uniref:DegT/DnrJ/EryC1/StrS family aminotransferase n=1 Tax=Candidatus Contubernalis alkaliaceticus TaxID=338645 RepID=UPI001F4BF054|nr:aminotransferase class I/II-fold pyridoxal phosphate-dependent enzyme [Candidatus Contubernalis alkalaceticus]UNC93615.1 aminotransferase class I/II-fold pyridoxal phosphate-dependent enzyme [Candidatus Contubernalis alkalaceticus]